MRWALLILGMLAPLVAACGSDQLLYDVSVEPAEITPNQDGDSDVARISYGIGAPARLRMALEAPDGTVHVMRDWLPRSPGPHEALFGGVIEGRMLPDGEYTLRLEARSEESSGAPEASSDADAHPAAGGVVIERRLVVSGGDTEPPQLQGLTVHPDEFTPNQDGIGDRVAISYALDEPTEVRLWLETSGGTYVTDILEEQESGEFAGEPGPHVYDYDAGVDADAPPPPDGDYVIVAEARDGAGHVSRQEHPLRISSGGQPRAAIIGDVEWGETMVPLGATLSFTATVKNVGGTPIRTRGPEPGYVYDNNQTFNSVAPRDWLVLARDGDEVAFERVPYSGMGQPVNLRLGRGAPDGEAEEGAADADGHTNDTGQPNPLCGNVELADGSPAAGIDVFVFESDGDNGRREVTEPDGSFCFVDLEPVPPHQLTYARSPGVVRLGLEYDEKRSDLAYPFRWQLGATEDIDVCETSDAFYLCLVPGETVEITGGVRFVDPPFRRSTNAYLALMHEDVRRMHGPYNPKRITIEY
jgi:hypothetical protein